MECGSWRENSPKNRISDNCCLNETTSGHMLKLYLQLLFYVKANVEEAKTHNNNNIFAASIASVTLSLSIVLRKILCRPQKGMLLLGFQGMNRAPKAQEDETELQGEAGD